MPHHIMGEIWMGQSVLHAKYTKRQKESLLESFLVHEAVVTDWKLLMNPNKLQLLFPPSLAYKRMTFYFSKPLA